MGTGGARRRGRPTSRRRSRAGPSLATITRRGAVDPVMTVAGRRLRLGRHPGHALRLQHPGEGGPALRQDRSAALPGRRRPGRREPGQRPGAARRRTRPASPTRRSATSATRPAGRTASCRGTPSTATRARYDQAVAQVEARRGDDPAAPGRAARGAGESRLHEHHLAGRRHRGLAQRHVGQTVAASFQTPTLFLIAKDLTKMQVDTNVSESDVGASRSARRRPSPSRRIPDRTFWGKVAQVRQAPITRAERRHLRRRGQRRQSGVRCSAGHDGEHAHHHRRARRRPARAAAGAALRTRAGGGHARPARTATRRGTSGRRRRAGATGGDTGATPTVWVLRDGEPGAVPVVDRPDDGTFAEIVAGRSQAGRRGDRRPRSRASAEPTAARAAAPPPRRPRFPLLRSGRRGRRPSSKSATSPRPTTSATSRCTRCAASA